MESILTSIKKLIGMTEDYEHFDFDVMTHINTTFMILNQLGVGPSKVFSIKDESTIWEDFLPADDPNFESVKTYVYLKAKLVFDPPTSSAVMESYKSMVSELEFRLNVAAENNNANGEEEIQNG